MYDLRDFTGETVSLHILKNNKRICVEQIQGLHILLSNAKVGNEFDLYCGAPGKCILSFLPDNDIEEIIKNTKFKKFTENTIIALFGQLFLIHFRRRRYP